LIAYFAARATPAAGSTVVMKITDSPHRAGTPEHGEWVRNVYIPAVEDERARRDSREHGAASIGGVLLRGVLLESDDAADLERLFVRVA
jgi:hypothetical protein